MHARSCGKEIPEAASATDAELELDLDAEWDMVLGKPTTEGDEL
jgi:hypothetical protein